MTTSWKLLFYMLKRNDFVVKNISCPVFSLCVYMCIMNVQIHGICICSFMFSLKLLGWRMTLSSCLSPVVRFNKVDWYIICMERRRRRVTVCFVISERNDLVIIILRLYIFSFHMEVTCSLHLFHLLYRGKRHQLRKPLLILFGINETQLRC